MDTTLFVEGDVYTTEKDVSNNPNREDIIPVGTKMEFAGSDMGQYGFIRQDRGTQVYLYEDEVGSAFGNFMRTRERGRM